MTPQRGAIRRAARSYLVVGVLLVLLSGGLGLWIFSRGDQPFAIDVWWNELVAGWWTPMLTGFSGVMNWVGGGWFGTLAVPIGGAVALIVARRAWAAAFFVTAEAVSAAGVQVFKHIFGRIRPEDMLIVSDYGSYPSGHVANATTIAVGAVILFPLVWVGLAGAAWVVLMAFSRTYLHAHWLTDTLGGALLGAGAALLVAAIFVVPLAKESLDSAEKRPSLG